MEFKIRLVAVNEDGSEKTAEEIILNKDYQKVEHLGLTLEESKEILKNIQKVILEQQTTAFVDKRSHCTNCGARIKSINQEYCEECGVNLIEQIQ